MWETLNVIFRGLHRVVTIASMYSLMSDVQEQRLQNKQNKQIKSVNIQQKHIEINVTPHGETRKKSLNPNPRYSQFLTNGVLYRPLGFFLLIIVPGCLFHNFLQTKLLKLI